MNTNFVWSEADYVAMREHEKRRNELLRNVRYEPTDGPSKYRWSAFDGANYDEGDPVGLGATREDALLDLIEQMEL